MHGNAAGCKVSLKEVVLFVHKVKPNSSIQLAHTKAFQLATEKYPLRRVEVKSFTVPMVNRSITKENLFLGQLPTQIVVGVVDNDAYNGAIQKSSFNFKHNNINFIIIYRDGVQIPSKLLQPDFANDRFIRSYIRLFTQTGQYYRDTGNAISREQFKNGCALFAFDLTPQLDSAEIGFELIKHGNIRIEIHFADAVAQTLTAVAFAENDNLLEIDRDRLHSMNSLQIEGLLKKDSQAKKIFKKVCALDEIEVPSYHSAYVINSDTSDKKGEHWVAVYFDKNRRGEYFDSYGLPPAILGLEAYMDRFSMNWIYNRKTIQSLFSNVCGHYCVYFILFSCRNISLHAILSVFTLN